MQAKTAQMAERYRIEFQVNQYQLSCHREVPHEGEVEDSVVVGEVLILEREVRLSHGTIHRAGKLMRFE